MTRRATVETPNQLLPGWREVRAGEVLEFRYGKALPARARREGAIPVLSSVGAVGTHDSSLVSGSVLVVGRKGAAGKVSIAKGPVWVIDTAYYAQVPETLSLQFLAYQLEVADLGRLDQSTAVPSLGRRDLESVLLRLPPLDHQHAIVAAVERMLGSVEAGEREIQAADRGLDKMRRSVLAAAVAGRLTPAATSGPTAAEWLEEILDLRRKAWEERELRRIEANGDTPNSKNWKKRYKPPVEPIVSPDIELPPDWTWATVDQLSTMVQYGSSKKTSEDGEVPVLRMGNIVEGRLDLARLKYLPADHDEFPDLLLKKGDVLFNRTNSAELVGKAAVYAGDPDPCSFASYLIRVRLIDSVRPELLVYYLSSAMGRAWVRSVVSQQVGQANVNGSKLKALTLPLPPRGLQDQVCNEVDAQLAIVEDGRRSLAAVVRRATLLRRRILDRAAAGQILGGHRIEEIESRGRA